MREAREPLVRLEHVDVVLDGRYVLRDLTWALHRGEHWAVLGPNGAGKSTFLRLVRGEIWPAPNSGARVYAFDGKPTRSPIGIRQRMALVSAEQQQRYLRLHARRYGDDFTARMTTAQLVFTGVLGADVVTRAPTAREWADTLRALEQVGIAHLAEAPFDRLSQGQLRRALIARALVARPEVLLLDEIGVGLDAPTRRALLALLQQLAEAGTQLVITTHRPQELPEAITHVMTLREGRIVHAEARARASVSRAVRPAAAWRPLVGAREGVPFIVALTRVSAAAEVGGALVLHDLTWRINEGEHWLVVGDNGVGKSTLLRLILGEIAPAHGRVERFNGAPLSNVWAIKQRIGYVSSELQARYAVDLTAEQVVASGFFASVGWLQPLTRAQQRRVREVMEQLGLQHLAQRSILAMSYGQARKVLLARALVNRPRLLILDEALDGLDAATRAEIAALLNMQARETTILMVTHHAEDVLPCITHRAVLAEGRLVQLEQRIRHPEGVMLHAAHEQLESVYTRETNERGTPCISRTWIPSVC
ncbi:MAG: ATP-binding cassette domain-containing protein [Thermoflexales bacterium]|nr:ATP-binding cassette domain-containing protein [Thermoflexales bacterium]